MSNSFETYEERGDILVSHINFTTLRDKVIGAKTKIKVEVDRSGYLYEVDGKSSGDKITLDYIIPLNYSSYKINILNFFISEGWGNIEKDIKDLKKKRKKDPTFQPELKISKTHGEYWKYQIDNFEEVEKKGKDEKRKKSSIINLNLDFPTVHQFFTEKKKISELINFVENIPQSGVILLELQDLLRILESILNGDSNIKIRKGEKDVHLPKGDYDKWKEDMVSYIGAFNKPENLDSIYKDNILRGGTFMNYLFNLKPEGVGRGEFMLCYAIPYSTLSGGSEDYDIEIFNQAIYEVKDYSSGSGEGGDIRLGTHGKLSQFEFFQHIKNSVASAKKTMDHLGSENLKGIVGKYNFEYWKNMTSGENYNKVYRAIPSAVNAGELTPERLRDIIDWHFLNHMLIEDESKDSKGYTMATLKGNNIEPKNVKIEGINTIGDKKTITVSELNDKEKMFNELRSLKYIQNPHKLIEDIENAPNNYFNMVLDKMIEGDMKFYFLIFRPNEIKVLSDSDFDLATITQSSIKISEKGSRTKDISLIQNAFKNYKELKEKNAIDEDFWDFYRKYRGD